MLWFNCPEHASLMNDGKHDLLVIGIFHA